MANTTQTNLLTLHPGDELEVRVNGVTRVILGDMVTTKIRVEEGSLLCLLGEHGAMSWGPEDL